jgi:gas vesicle protein
MDEGMEKEPDITLIAEEEGGWDAGSFLTGLILGATVGAGVALLMAPSSGPRTRRRLRRRARHFRRNALDRWSDTRDRARDLFEERRADFRSRVARARARGHNGQHDEDEEDED